MQLLLWNGKDEKTLWPLWWHGDEDFNADALGLSIWKVCDGKLSAEDTMRLVRRIRARNANLWSLRRQWDGAVKAASSIAQRYRGHLVVDSFKFFRA
jgi:hypothetical protein